MLLNAITILTIMILSIIPVIVPVSSAQINSFPNSHTEVNSMNYQSRSIYTYAGRQRTIGYNRSISILRTFPSTDAINITDKWVSNSTLYPEANAEYKYTIYEGSNVKFDLGNLPVFLAGAWMQRFPNGSSTANITLDEISIITELCIQGIPTLKEEQKVFTLKNEARTANLIEITGEFVQNCGT